MRTAVCMAVFLSGGLALAAPPKEKAKAKGADINAMLAAMARHAAPGPQHARLQAMEGDWDTQLTVYLGGKAQAGEKGKAEFFPILDGRFIAEEYRGTFMGKPVSSHIVFGYDNAQKKYSSIRVTSLATDIMVREGQADASGNTITLTGVSFDAVSGKPGQGRMVYRFDGKDKITVEVYETAPGRKETRLFDVVYMRRKA